MAARPDTDILLELTEPIRRLAAMSNEGASCESIGSSVSESIVSLMPGSRAIIMVVGTDGQKAIVISSRNAPHIDIGDEFLLRDVRVLWEATRQPGTLARAEYSERNPLFPASAGFPENEDEIVLCKADRRADGSQLLVVVISGPENVANGPGVLATLGELLTALCAGVTATRLHDESLGAIARAKREWERTVDALPEIVCLIDAQGAIVRANRTVERWSLANVTRVRGLHVHGLLHPDCDRRHCALRDAVSVRLAAQSTNGFLETALTDADLGRTIIVHTRLMNGLPTTREGTPQVAAVVVVSDVSALRDAQDELEKINAELERRVEARTRQLELSNAELEEEVGRRRAAEQDLQRSRDELAELSMQLLNAQEDERRRLSRELHDSLGQTLGAIKYSLERIAAMHENPELGDAQAEIGTVVDSIADAIKETRAMALNLRPPVLDDIGIVPAIGWLCQRFAETYTDTEFHIEVEVGNDEIPQQLSTPVYRISQEALNNVVKHANARTVLVSLQVNDNRLTLEILDDGIGFDANVDDTGRFQRLGRVGRLGMRERAIASHGLLDIWSQPGQGTRVRAEWDLARISYEEDTRQ